MLLNHSNMLLESPVLANKINKVVHWDPDSADHDWFAVFLSIILMFHFPTGASVFQSRNYHTEASG